MCGDRDDPNNPDSTNAPFFFGPTFGFSPSAAKNDPDNTSTTVSEVVVHAPSKPPVQLLPPATLSITSFNVKLQQLDVPVLQQNLPTIDSWYIPTKPTPCVTRAPAVGVQAVNDMMYPLALRLLVAYIQDGREHAGFVYRMPDGSLHQSHMIAGDSSGGRIHGSIFLPPGAAIVGYAHTHPWDGTDQTTPSPSTQGFGNDEDFINSLAASTHGDADMLSYIITPKAADNSSFGIYVYDRNHLHNPPTGCELWDSNS